MRHDIQPNERAYSSKEVAEVVGIATATVRKYGQILERNGYEFLKEGHRRIFVRTDIEAIKAIRSTKKPLDDKALELVNQQKERLKGSNETSIAVRDTYGHSPQDPHQLKELLMILANELRATRELNVQLTSDMSELKTTVSRLQQDHHVISSGMGNQAQKVHAKIKEVSEQQKIHYEKLLQHEKQKNEFLHKELQHMRDEQKREWQTQNDFNKRLEEAIHRPKGIWERLVSLFR